jgi:hypothetical protein
MQNLIYPRLAAAIWRTQRERKPSFCLFPIALSRLDRDLIRLVQCRDALARQHAGDMKATARGEGYSHSLSL